MAGAFTTSVETLDGNKVRLHVEVSEAELDKAIEAAFKKLANEVKIDGFRKGKVPRRLLEARLGTEIARDQALRDSLPDYYARAVREEDLDTIAAPEIDITAGETEGDLEFDAVVELRPHVELDGYERLKVELDVALGGSDAVDQQIEALRGRFADLEDSEAPLTDGDYAEIDLKGSVAGQVVGGLSTTDYLYEVGSGLVVPELDRELHGARPGAILSFTAALPETSAEHAGEEVSFQVLVKETKQKVLPEVTDEWVSEVSEFDTTDDLRADIARRVEAVAKLQAQMALRERVLDAASDLVTVEIPDALVERELEHRIRDVAERLGAQGVSIEQYLEGTGRDREQFLAEMRDGATRAARADLALRAIVAQEGIEADDSELDAEIERLAERHQENPKQLRKELDRRGVLEAVRSDLARGKALQFLVDHADVVDADGNMLDLSMPEPDGLGPDGEERERQEHESHEGEEKTISEESE